MRAVSLSLVGVALLENSSFIWIVLGRVGEISLDFTGFIWNPLALVILKIERVNRKWGRDKTVGLGNSKNRKGKQEVGKG